MAANSGFLRRIRRQFILRDNQRVARRCMFKSSFVQERLPTRKKSSENSWGTCRSNQKRSRSFDQEYRTFWIFSESRKSPETDFLQASSYIGECLSRNLHSEKNGKYNFPEKSWERIDDVVWVLEASSGKMFLLRWCSMGSRGFLRKSFSKMSFS